MQHAFEYKYLGYISDKSGTYGSECSRNVASGRGVSGAICSIVNDRDLQLDSATALNETLLVPVLMYGSETGYGRRRRD